MPSIVQDFVYSPEVEVDNGDVAYYAPARLTLRSQRLGHDTHYTWCALDGTPVLTGLTAKVMAQTNAELMLECGFHL